MSPYFEGCDRLKAQHVVFDRRQRKRLTKKGRSLFRGEATCRRFGFCARSQA